MKKIVFLIMFLMSLSTFSLIAQNLTDQVVFNAVLNQTLNINVPLGDIQTITFTTAADYNNGVVGGVGIMPGTSTVTVEATEDWNVTIECPDFVGTGATPNTEIIPINNLGVYVTAGGVHQYGVEYTTSCPDAANAMGLNNNPVALIENLGGNAGAIPDNTFILNWEMGTMKVAHPTNPMHATSMFTQMANDDFITGTYTATATLTLALD